MGIENVVVSHVSVDYTVNSLPLMGIENTWSTRSTAATARSHYPSWGSKTSPTGSADALAVTTHYPSWGSKTRSWPLRQGWFSSSHYPSWGSKTSWLVASTSRRCVASLPLMGIENIDQEPEARAIYDSLPLMGIENGRVHGTKRRAGGLITPHGDRKPGGHCCRLPKPPASHYPSWGSKTRVPGLDRLRQDFRLITPHGDRKPPPPAVAQEGRVPHSLPLMGIENAHVGRIVWYRYQVSLPLMGIENPLFQRTAGLFVALCDRDRYLPRPGVVLFAAICAPEPRDSRGFLLRRRVVSDK